MLDLLNHIYCRVTFHISKRLDLIWNETLLERFRK
jgi:hypothetical protein